MSVSPQSIAETRLGQIFPVLRPSDIGRMRRFGETRCYTDGQPLLEAGKVGDGLFVFFSGRVEVTQRDALGRRIQIVTYAAGSFMGELAQLAGRPALADAHARGLVEALIIRPDKLRALLIAEAELGERIMRALILRRVMLLEAGTSGPVIIGRPQSGDVL